MHMGAARAAYDISKTLIKAGHEVTVYTTDVYDVHSRFKYDKDPIWMNGIKVHHFKNLNNKLAYKNLPIAPTMAFALNKNIKNFDIVHLHEYRTFQGNLVHYYAKKYDVPYILHANGSIPKVEKMVRKWLYDTLFGYKILKNASKLIALSRTEAEQFKEFGIQEDKIAIIPHGIDLSQYKKLTPKGTFKKKYGIENSGKKIILYLGRIHRTKGIDFLLKAYAYLIKNMKYKDALLVIAGPDDGYLNDAKQLVTSLKVADEVVFTRMLLGEEKIGAYVDSSVVVNVEPSNVFGLVPLEAAACSTPVIVSRDNAISGVVHQGEFGFSVKHGDINELAGIIREMLRNDDLLRELGQRGRKFVFENYGWANIVNKLEKVYEELAR